MSSKNIVVLGSLHYDIFIESDKIPEVGETVLEKNGILNWEARVQIKLLLLLKKHQCKFC